MPDGRTRRSTLANKTVEPDLYRRIAERVMELSNQGRLYGEIAAMLNVDRNTVTAAVAYWHEQRKLPVPDGRSRRKLLLQKVRAK